MDREALWETEYSDEHESAESVLRLVAEVADVGKRADSFISERSELTRSAAVRLIEGGNARLEGGKLSKNYKMREGDVLLLELPAPEPSDAQPENIPLDIIYEDSDIIVVNKPEGMVVHPAPGNTSGTLVNALLYHCGDTARIVGEVLVGAVWSEGGIRCAKRKCR